jgi:hypothetical protein
MKGLLGDENNIYFEDDKTVRAGDSNKYTKANFIWTDMR